MSALIPTKLKKEDMTIEQLAGSVNHIIVRIASGLYKVMPAESLKHPDEDYYSFYGSKKEIRKDLEKMYDSKKDRNKAIKK